MIRDSTSCVRARVAAVPSGGGRGRSCRRRRGGRAASAGWALLVWGARRQTFFRCYQCYVYQVRNEKLVWSVGRPILWCFLEWFDYVHYFKEIQLTLEVFVVKLLGIFCTGVTVITWWMIYCVAWSSTPTTWSRWWRRRPSNCQWRSGAQRNCFTKCCQGTKLTVVLGL